MVGWYCQGELKTWERHLSHCHCVHKESHMDWPGFEPRFLKWVGRQLAAWGKNNDSSLYSLRYWAPPRRKHAAYALQWPYETHWWAKCVAARYESGWCVSCINGHRSPWRLNCVKWLLDCLQLCALPWVLAVITATRCTEPAATGTPWA